jgi:hypothetical protein
LTPRAPQPAQPARPARDRVEERLGRLEPTVADRLGHLDTTVDDEVDAHGAAMEQRLGHIKPETAAPDGELIQETVAEATPPLSLTLPRVTRDALRHAIVMREILGPPVAIRPPE